MDTATFVAFILLILAVLFIVFVSSPEWNYRNQVQPTQNQLTAYDADALVLACIDFRLIDDYVYFMDSLGYNNNYNDFVLK